MSETDSFIQEVSEEVRRDRLFKLLKRYGWIALLLVLLLVGGAAFFEFQKSRSTRAAQAFGDGLLEALQADQSSARITALRGLDATTDQSALVAHFAASQALDGDEPAIALEILRKLANNADVPEIYRHLAEFKMILIEGSDRAVADRLETLARLSVPGAAFRLLAEEQIALVMIDQGDNSGAIEKLQAILADGEITAGLRRRVSQLIVALGGDLDAS